MRPHHHTPPDASSAMACRLAAAIATMRGSPAMRTGFGEPSLDPVPNSPFSFDPHAHTAPSVFTA